VAGESQISFWLATRILPSAATSKLVIQLLRPDRSRELTTVPPVDRTYSLARWCRRVSRSPELVRSRPVSLALGSKLEVEKDEIWLPSRSNSRMRSSPGPLDGVRTQTVLTELSATSRWKKFGPVGLNVLTVLPLVSNSVI
jgi:hypothetical protein